jgi:hypothetical protein
MIDNMKKALFVLVPSLIICGIVIAFKSFSEDNDCVLETGKSYEVWLKEAEVSAFDRSGVSWDTDGSAPDLRGMISWQDQVVLQTVEASDGLIARWSDTAISASQAIQGEADTQSLQRVGRFRMDSKEFIEIGIFDGDLVSSSFAGGFRIPLSSLRLGNNRVHGSGTLKSVAFRVSESDSVEEDQGSNTEWKLTIGVLELIQVPEAMKSASERLVEEAGKYTDKITDELQKQREALGEELEKGVNELMKNLNFK